MRLSQRTQSLAISYISTIPRNSRSSPCWLSVIQSIVFRGRCTRNREIAPDATYIRQQLSWRKALLWVGHLVSTSAILGMAGLPACCVACAPVGHPPSHNRVCYRGDVLVMSGVFMCTRWFASPTCKDLEGPPKKLASRVKRFFAAKKDRLSGIVPRFVVVDGIERQA